MAVALLSFVGVLSGAIVGVRLAPLVAAGVESPTTRIIVSIVVVVLLVAVGETTGVFFGRRIRDRITGERTLQVDSTLGSVLQALTVVVAAWLVALPLASASFPGLAAGVRGSEVLRAVDSVMPAGPAQLPRVAPAPQQLRLPGRTEPVRRDPDHRGGSAEPGLAQRPMSPTSPQRAQDARPRPVVRPTAGGHRFRDRAAARDDQRARRRRTADTSVEVLGRRGRTVELDANVISTTPRSTSPSPGARPGCPAAAVRVTARPHRATTRSCSAIPSKARSRDGRKVRRPIPARPGHLRRRRGHPRRLHRASGRAVRQLRRPDRSPPPAG